MLTRPDYGVYPSTIISPEGDMGEIIARLGGPRFRREGRVLSFANFSPDLDGWQPTTNVNINMRLGVAFVGNSSLLFFGSPPTNPYMARPVPNTQSLRMGLEAAINQESAYNLTTLEIQFHKPTEFIKFAVRVNATFGKIDYLDNTNNYVQLITGLDTLKSQNNWINLKLVADADISPAVYVRFMVNNVEYTMGQQGFSTSPTVDQGTKFQIQAQSADGVFDYRVWIDAAVITTNER